MRKFLKRALCGASLLIAASCASAPPPVTQAAASGPPCTSATHRAFDFWLGEWNVWTVKGKLAGENTITREEYGCVLVEHWKGSDGITGQSYNFVDPANGDWRQVWVSGGSVIDMSGGLAEDGAMRLEGTIRKQNAFTAIPFRGTWTPQADGKVIQEFRQYDKKTGAWNEWFIGTYTRKEQSAPP